MIAVTGVAKGTRDLAKVPKVTYVEFFDMHSK